MSERLKNTSKVSNEEVINDLTKDLQSSLNTNEKTEFVISPGTSCENVPTSSGDQSIKTDTFKANPIPPPDTKEWDENYKGSDDESNKDSDVEVEDEVARKDAEMELTDDQREERKIIAEELKVAGNKAFKDGDYELSIEKYTEGLRTCPLTFPQQRAILHCNRSAANMKLEKYKKAIKDCTKAIELDEKYLKAYIRRAQSYEASDKLDESLEDFKKILELDPLNKDAQQAMVRLPPRIEERNEKLKTEMFGKLKDLGNMILKPFGLSTENFKLEQDPESKGYKINFKQ